MNPETIDKNNFKKIESTSKHETLIKSASPWKAMLRICIPSILIMVVSASYNVIDKFLAIIYAAPDVSIQYHDILNNSDMSAESLINLATTFSSNIVGFNFAIAIMIGAGSSILFSMKYGSLDKKGMVKTANNGFSLTLITSIIVGSIMLLLISPATNYFLLDIQSNTKSQDPAITEVINELSYQYTFIACAMLPFSFISNIFINIYRSEGKMALVTTIMLSSIVINIIFAIILIHVCHLMLMGAMLATGIAWVAMTIICVVYSFFSNNTYFKFNWYYLIHIDFKYIRDILVLGLTAFINNLSTVVLAVLLTILLGDLDLGNQENHLQILYGGLSPWMFFLIAPAAGIYQGGSVLLGYAYGSNRLERYKELMKIVFIMEIVWFTVSFLLVLSFGGYMLQLFGDYYPDHRWLIVLNFMTFPFAGITYSLTTYMRNIKRAGISTLASIIRAFIAPISLAVIAFFVTNETHNEYGFFAIFGLFDLFSAAAIYLLLRKEIKLYRNYHHDIDIEHPENFERLEVIRISEKINYLTIKKENVNNEKCIKVIDQKIAKYEEKIKKEKEIKAEFVARALLELNAKQNGS